MEGRVSGGILAEAGRKGERRAAEVRKKARAVCIVGAVFCLGLGAVSHFFFEWSGGDAAAAVFFPANESVWEHLKLVFFPFFVWFFVALPFADGLNNRVFGAFAATYIAAGAIPCVFYIYTAFTGRAVLAADIATFVAGVLAGYAAAYAAFTRPSLGRAGAIVGAAGLLCILTAYLTLTVCAPDFFLFNEAE